MQANPEFFNSSVQVELKYPSGPANTSQSCSETLGAAIHCVMRVFRSAFMSVIPQERLMRCLCLRRRHSEAQDNGLPQRTCTACITNVGVVAALALMINAAGFPRVCPYGPMLWLPTLVMLRLKPLWSNMGRK